jgi:hypothetical protein
MSEYLRRIYFSKSEIHPCQCNVGLTIRPPLGPRSRGPLGLKAQGGTGLGTTVVFPLCFPLEFKFYIGYYPLGKNKVITLLGINYIKHSIMYHPRVLLLGARF